MKTNLDRYYEEQWRKADSEVKRQWKKIDALKEELRELKHKQEIAVNNAYMDGYDAGLMDARKRQRA